MNNDLISRSALLEWVLNQKAEAYGVYGNIIRASIDAVMQLNVANAIRKAPAVDAEPVRHGRWVDKTNWNHGLPDYRFECSECSYTVWSPTYKTNYCPNCGAKMDGDT